jgi:polyphenol oxidase
MKKYNYKFLGKEYNFFKETRIQSSNFLSSNLGVKVKYSQQVHGDDICVIDSYDFDSTKIEADAIITALPNLAIGVYTADCIPLIFTSDNIIAVAHLGRKGMLLNLAGSVINKLKSEFSVNVEDLKCFVGAHLSVNNHIVFEEEATKFPMQYVEFLPVDDLRIQNIELINSYTNTNNLTKRDLLKLRSAKVNLTQMLIHQLLAVGILQQNIRVSNICTFESNSCHSYRRDYPNHGMNFGYVFMSN